MRRDHVDAAKVCAITMFCGAEMLSELLSKPPGIVLRAMADLVDDGWSPVHAEQVAP